MTTRWKVDNAPDADDFFTIRQADGTEHGRTDVEPIATVYLKRHADSIVRDHNAAQGLRGALQAIAARIQGEYDNPALVKQGSLSTDIRTDCLNYAQAALRGATEKGE